MISLRFVSGHCMPMSCGFFGIITLKTLTVTLRILTYYDVLESSWRHFCSHYIAVIFSFLTDEIGNLSGPYMLLSMILQISAWFIFCFDLQIFSKSHRCFLFKGRYWWESLNLHMQLELWIARPSYHVYSCSVCQMTVPNVWPRKAWDHACTTLRDRI